MKSRGCLVWLWAILLATTGSAATPPAPDGAAAEAGPAGRWPAAASRNQAGTTTGVPAAGKPPPRRQAGGAARPSVGAIRWDGWFANNPWEKNLSDPRWHNRLPFFARVRPTGEVRVCGDSQAVMDREIRYARAGGLGYWAFCYYHPRSAPSLDAYNYGWRRYLASRQRAQLNFCLLLQGGAHLGPTNEWAATVAFFVRLFQEPGYERVGGDRPLVYVYAGEQLIPHFGSARAAGDAVRQLRRASAQAGTGNPYLVAQIWPHQVAADFLAAVEFDALGAYSAHGSTNGGAPYAQLVEMNQWYWNHYRATGRAVVPLVNAGWDGRPRAYPGAWYEAARPDELANAVKRALDWSRAHPETARAQTVLIYAWNEYDEGGWLCPTRREGDARLRALRNMLDAYR